MKQATFTEVRNHAKQFFDIVEAGEFEILVGASSRDIRLTGKLVLE